MNKVPAPSPSAGWRFAAGPLLLVVLLTPFFSIADRNLNRSGDESDGLALKSGGPNATAGTRKANKLLNAGFEAVTGAGEFDGWNKYDSGNVVPDPADGSGRSGSRAVQMWGRYNGRDNTSGIYQDLWACSGERWQASVWGRNRPFDAARGDNEGRLKLEFVGGNGAVLTCAIQTVLTSSSPTNYEQFFVTAIAPPGTARVRIVMEYFQAGNGDGSVNFDDAGLELLSPNGLSNAGFEGGNLEGWTLYGPGWDTELAWSPSPVHSGGCSFKIWGGDFIKGNPNFTGAYQDCPAEPGESYLGEGWFLTKAGDRLAGVNQAWLEVSFRDSTRTNVLALFRSAIMNASSPPDTWTYLATTNQYNPETLRYAASVAAPVAPAGTCTVRFRIVFFQEHAAAGSVFCDDVCLTRDSRCTADAPAAE